MPSQLADAFRQANLVTDKKARQAKAHIERKQMIVDLSARVEQARRKVLATGQKSQG